MPSSVDPSIVEQRIVEAAAVLPDEGAVTGWAALRWCGAAWFGGFRGDGRTPLRVPLVMCGGEDARPQAGFTISHEHLRLGEVRIADGLPITSSERSALYEMRHAGSLEDAVVAADMAMQADLVTPHELASYAATLGTWTGIPQAREALRLACENSWSPQETRLRLLWVRLAGLPQPLCNVPVFDHAGRHIGTPDLMDPVAGVVGEYEGVVHLDRGRRGHDVRREQAFRAVGLEYFPVVVNDWSDRESIAARIRAAYARAAGWSAIERAWTIEPPSWWVPTDTVARRRALSSSESERLLRYRSA